MGRIYKQAQPVHVHLGEAKEDDAQTVRLMKKHGRWPNVALIVDELQLRSIREGLQYKETFFFLPPPRNSIELHLDTPKIHRP